MKKSILKAFVLAFFVVFIGNVCFALGIEHLSDNHSIRYTLIDLSSTIVYISWLLFAIGIVLFILCRFDKFLYGILLLNVISFLINFIVYVLVLSPTMQGRVIAFLGILVLCVLLYFSLVFRQQKRNKLAYLFIIIDSFIVESVLYIMFATF